MPDWRWVTQVSIAPPGTRLPPTSNGMWLDFDGVDTIMPLPEGRYSGARTRLGWCVGHGSGWNYMFITEQIEPIIQHEGG